MDYYDILGVNREATENEIKKNYYQLAKEYHPDRTNGDTHKNEKFLEIQEAYAHLSDKDKRCVYDLKDVSDDELFTYFSHVVNADSFVNMNFAFDPASLEREVNTTHVPVTIDLREYLEGGTKAVAVDLREQCTNCTGTGIADPHINTSPCNACDGTGLDRILPIFPCSRCNGKKFRISRKKICTRCNGSCHVISKKDFVLSVPKLCDLGQILHSDGFTFEISYAFDCKFHNKKVILKKPISIINWLRGSTFDLQIYEGKHVSFKTHGAFDLQKNVEIATNVLVEFHLYISQKHVHVLRKLQRLFQLIFKSKPVDIEDEKTNLKN